MTEGPNAMRCHEVNGLLMEFLDGGLAAGPAAEVRQHLAGCARCAAARDDLRAALALVHTDVVPEPPPGTWERFALDVLTRDERDRAVARAIAGLPPQQRATLTLRVHQGLSHKEIAEVLDCSEGTAKANYFHAVRGLQARLGRFRDPT